jgi:hypothetical protein
MAKNEADQLTGTFDNEDPEGYDEADSLLGPAIKAVSFPEIGATVTGVITKVETSDQTDPDGSVKTFDSGQVRRQVVLTLLTDEQDPDDADDTGERRLYVKGFMVKAFRDAMRKADARGPRVHGKVTVTYVADGEAKGKGMNPPKLFTVEYVNP